MGEDRQEIINRFMVDKANIICAALGNSSSAEEHNGAMMALLTIAAKFYLDLKGLPHSSRVVGSLLGAMIRGMDEWSNTENN